jgi:hypothetical protein
LNDSARKADIAVIRAKRIDAADVAEAVVPVDIPRTDAAQQALLTDLVRERYPDAEFRSFANEAASFLDHKLLVIAAYRRAEQGLPSEDSADDDSQEQLFAA